MTLIFFQVDLGPKSKQCDGSVTGSRSWGSATAIGKRGLTVDVQETSLEDSQSRAPILGPACPQCSSSVGAPTAASGGSMDGPGLEPALGKREVQ